MRSSISGRATERVLDSAVVVSAVAAVVAASLVLLRSGESGSSDGATRVRAWAQYAESGQRMGPDDAAVVIVEFGDYECPACKASETHFEAVRRRNPDLAFVYRHFPLPAHQSAFGAAEAAECAADQGRFWEMHAGLYAASSLSGESFEVIAEQAKVPDMDVFRQCLADGRTRSRIELDRQAARQLGAPGTPTYLVNGYRYLGLRDSLAIEEIIAEAR